MPRRRPVELNVSHERWLVSYSDFITLLFAFFVVMYSISQVSESKFRILSNTLIDAFETSEQSLNPVQVGNPSKSTAPTVIKNLDAASGDMPGDGAFERTADLPQLADQFTEEFSDFIDDRLVQVNSNEFWLQIDLKSSVLFSSGQAEPTLEARAIFGDVAKMLKGFSNPVQVEGFTDNIPINSRYYPSNWELSAARAAAIVQLLVEGGVSPERLAAVGYGEHQPIADNGTEAGRIQNRRVALMIAREKMERPKINTVAEVERAIGSATPDVSQVHPQPGLEEAQRVDSSGEESSELTSEEMQARMESLLQQGEAETSTALADILREKPAEESQAEEPVAPPPAQVGDIQTVELEGGGLLFSSDPELSRKSP